MTDGWIKTHRDLLDHWLMNDAVELRAWLRLLLLVNWRERTGFFHGKEQLVEPGCMLTSYEHLARNLMVTPKQVRRLVTRWKEAGMVTYEGTAKGAKLSVCNYGLYQEAGQDKGRNKASIGQQKDNIIRKKKEEGTHLKTRDKQGFLAPTIAQCSAYATDIQMRQSQAEEFHDFYQSKGWMVGRSPMKDWRAAMRRWKRTSPPLPATVIAYFQQHPAYFGEPEIAALEAERFGKHYEGVEWKTGSGQRITDFTKKADQWIANNRARQ